MMMRWQLLQKRRRQFPLLDAQYPKHSVQSCNFLSFFINGNTFVSGFSHFIFSLLSRLILLFVRVQWHDCESLIYHWNNIMLMVLVVAMVSQSSNFLLKFTSQKVYPHFNGLVTKWKNGARKIQRHRDNTDQVVKECDSQHHSHFFPSFVRCPPHPSITFSLSRLNKINVVLNKSSSLVNSCIKLVQIIKWIPIRCVFFFIFFKSVVFLFFSPSEES